MIDIKCEIGNHEKRVSYILITRNRANYVAKTLTNIREFITPSDELIVMDGGSTDTTTEVIKKNADIVTIFESEKDYGSAHALNKGILKCRGRYIMNLNDDDYFFPTGVSLAVNVLEEHPEIDALICGGEYCQIDPVSGIENLVGYQYLPPSKTLTSDVGNFFHYTSAGFLIFRKNIVARVGLLDTTIQACDTEYCSRLLLSKVNFKYLNIKMFRHICHPGSSQQINAQEGQRDRIRIAIRHKLWDEVIQNPWSEISTVMGLSQYPIGGWRINDRIHLYHMLRRFKYLYGLINLLSYVPILLGLMLFYPLRWMKQMMKRLLLPTNFKKYNNKLPESQVLVEPEWDGSLR